MRVIEDRNTTFIEFNNESANVSQGSVSISVDEDDKKIES